MPTVVGSFFVFSWIAIVGLPNLANAQQGDVSLAPAPLAPSKEMMVKEGVDREEPVLGDVPDNEAITAPTYAFTATTAALADMSSGTTQLVGAGLDDTASAVTNIGFEFWYDGTRFTQFSVNANGLVRLGPAAVSTAFTNDLAITANSPKIAPYWEDICTGSTGKVHYKVIGAAPNRKLVVEWLNMQISRGAGCSGVGNGTFQLWLFESTGVIQFVYGAIQSPDALDGGYSIGMQSGAATNFASVTTTANGVSYAVANNTQMTPIPATTSYFFTPLTPSSPTALTINAITAISMNLNWTDTSSNEVGFAIYRSDDGGATYNFVAQTAANATSSNQGGLNPSTTYFWRVFAVTEGVLSASSAAGSAATIAAGNITSVASGNWSSPATWSTGVVPTGSDNVTIADGHTVTIDSSGAAFSVTVGQGTSGVLEFEPTTAHTLTTTQSVVINPGGAFQTSAIGTVTANVLSVGGSLTNNGRLDFSTNANTAGALIAFTGAANSTFGGSGTTTNIRSLTVNKGTSNANILELNPANLTVQGVSTDVAGFLTITNGTLKISGTFFLTNRLFNAVTYSVPATGGIWLNNPNVTVAAQAGSADVLGLFRLTQGTYNVGTLASHFFQSSSSITANFIIEGGTLNCSGRLSPQSAMTFTQSGGTINVATVGNTASNFGSFELFSVNSSFTMSGGTINVINPNTGATKDDFRILSNTANITGGMVILGATGAPPASTYNITGQMPSFTVNTGHTAAVFNTTTTSATLRLLGSTVTNNGTIISGATALNPRFDFAASVPMTYDGTGTFGTTVTPFAGVGVSSASVAKVTLNAPIVTNRVNLFQGGFINSNQITLGNGGASTTFVQVGATGLATPAGSFDVSPIHNQGAGEVVSYLSETAPRTTGVEINPTRTLLSMTVDNTNNVTIAGGDLTLSGSGTALTLTNGRIITGSNTLILSSDAAAVARTNGAVDGRLTKVFAVNGAKTFEVGTVSGYTPVAFNVTSGTLPAAVTVSSTEDVAPGLQSATSLMRFWSLTASGVVADLTFQYLGSDVPASATESSFKVLRRFNGGYTDVGGAVTPATHQATVSGVSQFSDFTLAQTSSATATVSGDQFVCEGSSANITVDLTGTAPWTLQWADGATETGISTTPHQRSVTPTSSPSTYTVTAVSDAVGLGTASGSATLSILAVPATPTATNTGPYVVGNSIQLSTPIVSGAAYLWSGPNGFSSILREPVIPNATTADDGVYSVRVNSEGCYSSPGSTSVIVTPLAPSAVAAAATTATNVHLTWNGSVSATGYEIFRRGEGEIYGSVGTVSNVTLQFDDVAVAGHAYMYVVQAMGNNGHHSPNSAADLATTVIFPSITPNVTSILASHFEQARLAINLVHRLAGLGDATFTDPGPLAGLKVKAQHVIDARSAIDAARTALGLPAITYSGPVVQNTTKIGATQMLELKAGVQ